MNPKFQSSWLLSSAGRRGALVKLLRQEPINGQPTGVVATDLSQLSAAGYLADFFEGVPRVTNPAFIDRTLEIAAKHNVKHIIPTIDPEISVYADHRPEFQAAGVNVWVSSPEVAQLGWDKWHLYQWLRTNDLPTVETYEVRASPGAAIVGPVVAKPRSGSSGIGVVQAETVGQLDVSSLDDSYIIQRRAPGFEVTVDFAVAHDGRILGLVPRRRLEVRGGEVSKGITVDYPEVRATALAVAESLPGAYGALNVQLFFDPATRETNVIEINPRFGGGYPLTHAAGANFIQALLRDSQGEAVEHLAWEPNTLMLRYDSEVIVRDFECRGKHA